MKYTHISYMDKPLYIDPALKKGGIIDVNDDFGAELSWGEEVNDNSMKIIILEWRFKMIHTNGKDAIRYVATDTFYVYIEGNGVDLDKVEILIDESATNFIKGWSNKKRNTLVMKKIITPPSIQAKAYLTTQIHKALLRKD